MNIKSLKDDFDNDENYKRLFVKKVYLYALTQVKNEGTWDIQAAEELAYDVTMEAVLRILEKEKKGHIIENHYAYLRTTVKHILTHPDFIFHKSAVRANIQFSSVGLKGGLNNRVSVVPKQQSYDPHEAYELIFFEKEKLTVQESRLIDLVTQGYSGKEIAEMMSISESKVTRLRQAVERKLGGNSHNNS